jgi:cytochrome c oxidase cbb3-type subunit 3/ubiquinol-cytochrome c reductase cytochrome c subunit
MRRKTHRVALLASLAAAAFLTGCSHIPGKPGAGPEVSRPEEVLEFAVLYKTNCAACHGENGANGAAIALANPVYLTVIGEDTLREVTAKGVKGKLMPPFARSAGGTLTDQQIGVLAQGMTQQWNKPAFLRTAAGMPAYKATLTADAAHGEQAYGTFCASCHGAHGEGMNAKINGKTIKVGSIVDPSYLDLISDQGLRSFVLAGVPGGDMPDWRTDASVPMSDQQVTDVVAWLAAKRTANPGQPYSTQK